MVRSRIIFQVCMVMLASIGSASAQYGAQMTSVGAINRSMGGTSTAAPLDTLGAFLWNPATITALPNSADMAVELMMPHSKLSSSVAPNAFGAGTPPIGLSGSDNSNSGVFPLPNLGIVYQPESVLDYAEHEMPISFGLGVLTVGGFGSNFPGSNSNPILMQPPLGVGPIFAQYVLTQIVPTVAVQVTDQLSVGISPMIDLANLSVDPGILSAPDISGGGAVYPPATHGTYQWGAGVQGGIYYKTENFWQFGASLKSPQWFNAFQFNSKDPAGAPRDIHALVNAPMIASIGTAYTGFERLLLALDLRYLDYANTSPFAASGVAANGTVNGLGWDSIFAVSTGAQYQLTDAFSLRGGYSFNTNPISNDKTFVNVATPLDIQHGIYFGGSAKVTERFKVSLAYAHFFANTISGAWVSPLGPIPGTNVTATSSADSVIASASFLF